MKLYEAFLRTAKYLMGFNPILCFPYWFSTIKTVNKFSIPPTQNKATMMGTGILFWNYCEE